MNNEKTAVKFDLFKKGKAKVLVSEPIKVYTGKRGTRRKVNEAIRAFKGEPLVYMIINKDDKVVYVGSSMTDGYSTLLRHFQVWNDPITERKYYDHKRYKVALITFKGMDNTLAIWGIESLLIDIHKPVGNKEGKASPYNHKSKEAANHYLQEARDNDTERVQEFVAFLKEDPTEETELFF